MFLRKEATVAKDPLEGQTVPTKEMAEKLSEMLGCSGSHKIGDAWGPCESDRDLKKLLELGNPEFREWKKRQSEKAVGSKLPKVLLRLKIWLLEKL